MQDKNAYPAGRACIRSSVVIFQLENHGCILKTIHMKLTPLEATQICNSLNLNPITNSMKQSLFQANRSSTRKEFPSFFGTQMFPPSLEPTNCPYHEPDQSTLGSWRPTNLWGARATFTAAGMEYTCCDALNHVEPSVAVLMIGAEVTTDERWSSTKYWTTFE